VKNYIFYDKSYIKQIMKLLLNYLIIFVPQLTSDFTIQVKGQPIYVHKAILKIRCQYFKNMFQHDWPENIRRYKFRKEN